MTISAGDDAEEQKTEDDEGERREAEAGCDSFMLFVGTAERREVGEQEEEAQGEAAAAGDGDGAVEATLKIEEDLIWKGR